VWWGEVVKKSYSPQPLIVASNCVEFGRYARKWASKRGRSRPETIYFLGFTLYCTRNQKGDFRVGLRTEKPDCDKRCRICRSKFGGGGTATGPSDGGALLAQNAEHPQPEGRDLVEDLSSDKERYPLLRPKLYLPSCGAASYRRAVSQLLTSAVREIRTLRSVGAGVGDRPGDPVRSAMVVPTATSSTG
jgi:hypothetical protein